MKNLYWFRISKPLVNICFRSGVITFQRRAPIFRLQRYPARASRLWRHSVGNRPLYTRILYCAISRTLHSLILENFLSLFSSHASPQALTNWSKVIYLKVPDRTEKWKPKLHIKRKLIFLPNTTIPNLSIFIFHLESISLKRWSNLNHAIPPKYS